MFNKTTYYLETYQIMQLNIISFLILLQVRLIFSTSLVYIFHILRIFGVLFQFFAPASLKSLVCKDVYLCILITIQENTDVYQSRKFLTMKLYLVPLLNVDFY